MGSACSCSQSGDEGPPSPVEGGSPPKEEGKTIVAMDQNGHVLTNGDVQNLSGNATGAIVEEAKHLITEAMRRRSHHSRGSSEGGDSKELDMSAEMVGLVQRLEKAVERLECLSPSGVGSASSQSASKHEASSVPFMVDYDGLLSGALKQFLDCSRSIGGDVATISNIVEEAFRTQRAFLLAASVCKQPSDSDLGTSLESTGKKIKEVINYRESHRTSPFFNHLSAVSESISGLSWVAVTPAPGPYVKEMGDAAVFYTNRVLKDFKDKDKTHVNWVHNWTNVFRELQSYIKLHHTTGVAWNPKGGNILSKLKEPSTGGIPPPPPGGIPPPPPMIHLEPKKIDDGGRNALFDDINRGTDITASLKKVPDSMKTHKNPSLREGPKPFVKSETGTTQLQQAPVNKPPRIELEGKKWFIEYQKNVPNLVLDNCRMEHSVYIYRCENTVVEVKGKVNSIILDSCKKSSVVFYSLVSACEIVNCQSCQVQVMDSVPTVSIEKTDGCQVYLSPNSLKTEIISAKSSEMNVMIPKGGGDYSECPVPEQFKTTINGLKLSTEITEKKG